MRFISGKLSILNSILILLISVLPTVNASEAIRKLFLLQFIVDKSKNTTHMESYTSVKFCRLFHCFKFIEGFKAQ